MRPWELAPAFVVVIATNAFMLARVAQNRAGAPEARVEMTERELPLVRLGDLDTGVALRIAAEFPALETAGLAPDNRMVEAFAALEYRAPGLVAVDIARGPEMLRRRYPGRTKVIVARALVRSAKQSGSRPQLVIPLVYVPAPYNRMLSAAGRGPHYRATLCYGSNAEPWVCDCRLEK
jgi:hypothetical protein